MTQHVNFRRRVVVSTMAALMLLFGATLLDATHPVSAAQLPGAGITVAAGTHPAPTGQEGGGKLTRKDWFKRAPVVIGAVAIVVGLDAIVIMRIVRRRRTDAARMHAPGPR